MAKTAPIIPLERIVSRIYVVRGEKVMLDSDLARLYGVSTTRLNQQFRRNWDRFPEDFAFQLAKPEFDSLMSQIAISNVGRGGRRKLPWVFTEHGVAMLSSVLHSKRAIQVNVAIVRAFIELRRILASNRELARKVEQHDRQIAVLFDTVGKLLAPPDPPEKHPIGFVRRRE